jgi:hypothetical protein
MKARLVQCIDGQWFVTEIDTAYLRSAMEARGFHFSHFNENPRVRPCLQGLPVFRELMGPCFDGDAARYEDMTATDHLSI